MNEVLRDAVLRERAKRPDFTFGTIEATDSFDGTTIQISARETNADHLRTALDGAGEVGDTVFVWRIENEHLVFPMSPWAK